MNILITSANNKRDLIDGFRRALQQLHMTGKVIATDSCAEVPAATYADDFAVQPRDDDPHYAQQWLQLCRRMQVRLLVPTRDGELEALAALSTDLQAIGVTVLTSPPEVLGNCLDKLQFYAFCRQRQFPVAGRVEQPQDGDFPLFARARRGSGAQAATRIDEQRQLPQPLRDFLVQPWLSLPEYSIDVLFSLTGQPLQAVVRERVEVVDGESTVCRLCDLPALEGLALELGGALGLCGPAVIQCFYSEDTGPLLIECNPRFGGASMVADRAGLDSCQRVLLELSGDVRAAAATRPIRLEQVIDRRHRREGNLP